MSPHSRNRGFTLIELLVVIAIIAVLVGLLLGAVQEVRRAAARTKCQNNLHNIALAIHNYHGTNGYFPKSGDPNQKAMNGNNTQLSWHVYLLPYMEQGNLYEQFSQAVAKTSNPTADLYTDAGKNDPHGMVLVPQYQCPTAASLEKDTTKNEYAKEETFIPGDPPFTTHYYGMCGPTGTNATTGQAYAVIPGTQGDPKQNEGAFISAEGIFQPVTRIAIRDVTDGTAATLLLGEMSWFDPVGGTRYRTWVRGNDDNWVSAGTRNVTKGINSYASQPYPYGIRPYMDMPMGSQHGRTANFAFADASVRTLNESVDLDTYKALASRAGGETPGSY